MFGHDPEAMKAIERSESEPALIDLMQGWLERTPGLENEGFNFWGKFQDAVNKMFDEQVQAILVLTCFLKIDFMSFYMIIKLYIFIAGN